MSWGRSRPAHRPFALEALEARVLLSGAPVESAVDSADHDFNADAQVMTAGLGWADSSDASVSTTAHLEGADTGGWLGDLGSLATLEAVSDSSPDTMVSATEVAEPSRPRSGRPGLQADPASGTISTDTTWSGTVVVTGDLTVALGVRLTVQAGTVVKFQGKMGMTVLGTLVVQGTAEAAVRFTSVNDDAVGEDLTGAPIGAPRAGGWEGLVISGAGSDASVLNQLEVRYAGNREGPTASAANHVPAVSLQNTAATLREVRVYDARSTGIRLQGGTPTLEGVDFRRVGSWPVSMDLDSAPKLSRLTASESTLFGILVDRGTLSASRTWDSTALPYIFPGAGRYADIGVQVPEGVQWTLKPGVVIKLADEMWITVAGTLTAVGTPDQPVIFTSTQDDSVGGDSLGNGSEGGNSARPGDWESLYFTSTSGASRLEHAEIRYAGNLYGPSDSATHNRPAISLSSTDLTLESVRIENVRSTGIRITGGSPVVRDVVFAGTAGWPVRIDLASNPLLRNLDASGSALKGVVVDNGELPGDRTWDVTGLPYVLTGAARYADVFVRIPVGITLTLKPGVVVKLADEMQ